MCLVLEIDQELFFHFRTNRIIMSKSIWIANHKSASVYLPFLYLPVSLVPYSVSRCKCMSSASYLPVQPCSHIFTLKSMSLLWIPSFILSFILELELYVGCCVFFVVCFLFEFLCESKSMLSTNLFSVNC